MKLQLTQELRSAKGQLEYVNSVLNSGFNLENWEKKEYQAVRNDLISQIESLNQRIELV